MKNFSILHKIMITILALFSSPIAFSACGVIPQTLRTGVITLAVDPRVNIGETLAIRVNDSLNGKVITTICSGAIQYNSTSTLVKSTTVEGAYETGIAGVGIFISDLWGGASRNVPYSINVSSGPASGWKIKMPIRFTFVKTGPINTGGRLGAIPIAKYKFGTDTAVSVVFGGMAVIQKSCLVSTSSRNRTISLGSPKKSEFNGIGSSAASSEREFNVELECQMDDIPIQVTFDPVGTSPSDGVINIDNVTDVAKGVAVEILDNNGNPLKFATPKTYHSAQESRIKIPLTARYKQIGNITPGIANAAMTFTITQN